MAYPFYLARIAVVFHRHAGALLLSAQYVVSADSLDGCGVLGPGSRARIPASRTAILFHGNGGTGLDRVLVSDQFLSRGYRLVLAEYPGYAARNGKPSEESNVNDGLALLEEIQRRFPIEPVVVAGESLGSGVAVQVAAKSSKAPSALVLITPFASMVDVAKLRMPIFPVEWLLKDRYDSRTHIQNYRGPVRFLISDKDELVGPATGLALHHAASARGATTLVRLSEAGHNNWWALMTASQWDQLLSTS